MSADFDALDLDTQEAYKRQETPKRELTLIGFLGALVDREEAEREAERKLARLAEVWDSDGE